MFRKFSEEENQIIDDFIKSNPKIGLRSFKTFHPEIEISSTAFSYRKKKLLNGKKNQLVAVKKSIQRELKSTVHELKNKITIEQKIANLSDEDRNSYFNALKRKLYYEKVMESILKSNEEADEFRRKVESEVF